MNKEVEDMLISKAREHLLAHPENRAEQRAYTEFELMLANEALKLLNMNCPKEMLAKTLVNAAIAVFRDGAEACASIKRGCITTLQDLEKLTTH